MSSDQMPASSGSGKTKLIKFPPSRAGKDVKCPGYAREGGMLKLQFDWYINPARHPAIFSTSGHVIIDCPFSAWWDTQSLGHYRLDLGVEGSSRWGELFFGQGAIYTVYRFVSPQRVWFFSCFGHWSGIDFSHFDHKQGFELENLILERPPYGRG